MTEFNDYRTRRDALEWAWKKACKKLGYKSACRVGCAACCIFDCAQVSREEAEALVELARSRPALADVLPRVKARAEDFLARLRAHEKIEAGFGKIPCDFLDLEQKTCRIYRERPFNCVIAISRDRQACAAVTAADVAMQEPMPWGMPEGKFGEIMQIIAQMQAIFGGNDDWMWSAIPRRDETLSMPLALTVVAFPELKIALANAARFMRK